MRKWTTTSLLFLAAASVYPFGANGLAAEKAATTPSASQDPTPVVKLLEEPAAAAPAVAPAAAVPAAAAPTPVPAAKPTEGQSLGKSEVNVSDAGTVEIHVNEANLVEVLRMLSLQSQKNIIASNQVRGTITANLYNVTIREALDAILKANGYGYREKGNFIYVYSAKELAEIEKSERQTVVEVFRLHYTPVANVVNMVKPVLSAEGQVAFTAASIVGIESGGKDTGGNSHATEDTLVVRDYPENIERVRKVIKDVDRRPQQILVEATIVAARLTEDNSLGVDFSIVGGVDFAGLSGGINNVLSGNVTGDLADKGVGGVGTGFTQGLPRNGMRVGVITNNVAVFLQALEQITDTVVLGNPKVLTLNKQRGEVLVGREDGYLTTTVTESTAVQSVEFLKTGTKLIFRPFIGDDGYIRMEVHPEDSDGKVVGGLPSKTTTEVTTNILVKDGHTIVIGGLFRESSATSRNQVPGIGNLPILGALFRNQTDATAREEIVILLTPHIVKDETSYTAASEQELKDMEKLRVGVRRGMMPWGRERLAEGSYENAVAEMNKPTPDRKKALWYLNCATNLNPKFLEAIKMKESLTGRELSAVDNSSVRGFVTRQVLAEQGATPASAPAEKKTVLAPNADIPAPAISAAVPAPTTQPVAQAMPVETKDISPVAPATQPAVAAVSCTESQPASEQKNDQPLPEALPSTVTAAVESTSPTTQPAGDGQSEQNVAVTELPVDEEAVPAAQADEE